jgi:hypothetical protein
MAVDGKWNVTVNSPMGAQKSELNFTADGGTLKGTGTAQGNSQEIADGKIDGNNIGWKVSITSPFPMTLEFAGTVDGDAMSGNVKAGSFGSFPWSGTRAA